MIRHDDDSNISSGTCYTLYLEYLGGLVPLLKGKRTSKIRPEFVIFDPQVNGKLKAMNPSKLIIGFWIKVWVMPKISFPLQIKLQYALDGFFSKSSTTRNWPTIYLFRWSQIL